jgi:hypothetical protein
MAITKKGARRIVVHGESYRWVVSPDDEPGLGIVVERDAGHGQRLVAWVEHGHTVSPALVRKVILYALSCGWTPSEKKQQMIFRLDDKFAGKRAGHDA